ncbi:hypothetical protein F3Y22_tig00111670pilonHSYRG00018 [Hibiscus syriacus]|uniref:Uncharacterized protein n=1 Tax=Hibiscus syriacus TaxID=106335 RepID=A0A6A2YIQ1_HIBSY|nr:hypothetical protein F3Y22_tig00111670pilonHSYRG00018 [Hibiscus syriacus]
MFMNQTLNRFSCIALGGVATEYLLFGYAEGSVVDINKLVHPGFPGCQPILPVFNWFCKLDGLLKGLGFTQKKANSQVRWFTVIVTVTGAIAAVTDTIAGVAGNSDGSETAISRALSRFRTVI